jgi:hypothetical protein
MKRFVLSGVVGLFLMGSVSAQDLKSTQVPSAVRDALIRKYPSAVKVGWEKEKGNFVKVD